MKRILIPILLALLLMLCATPVYAGIPALPHAFYGNVAVNGSPAPDGTQVSATVDVGDTVPVQNPVSTAGGKYGNPYLLVQGNIQNGTPITFHVTNENGTAVGGTGTFETGGGPTKVDLSVVIKEPEPEKPLVGGGMAGPSLPTSKSSLDGVVGLSIPPSTIARDKKGVRVYDLTVVVDESPPPAPEESSIIGLPYKLGPAGTTFSPAITLTFKYTQDTVPEGVNEEDLVVAFYDEAKGEWVELECEVDTENNVITAKVSHFTTFAIIGKLPPPPVPTPKPEPAPKPTPAPEPAPVPKPAPVIVPTPEPEPTPEPVEPPVVEPLPVEPDKTGMIWAIIAIFISIPVIVFIVVMIRKRKRQRELE